MPLSAPSTSHDASTWRARARRARAAGRVQEAARAAHRVLQLDPTRSEDWQLLGEILVRLSQLARPQACFEQAVRLDPSNANAWVLLGQTRMAAGDLDGADQALAHALRVAPRSGDAVASRGRLLVRQRRYDEARALLEPLVVSAHPGIAWAWGLLCLRTSPIRGVQGLRRALPHATGFTRTQLLFLLGDLLDAMGLVDPAYAVFQEANESQPASFDPDAYDAAIDARIARSRHRVCGTAGDASETHRALWIVGMPRSGTSLFEQMLGAHSQVHPGGERHTLPHLERSWCDAGHPLDATDLSQQLGRDLQQLSTDAAYVTDKLPDNLLRLDLAARIAPGSSVIHVRRAPLDTLWSCYRQNFGVAHAWTTQLPWLGRVYRAQQRIAAHYRQTIDLRWIDVEYADLVRDPHTVMSTVLGQLGLDLEPACLAPHAQTRIVATASAFEVQQPIHMGSLGRAEAYRRHLAPLRQVLDEVGHDASG